MLTTLTTLTTRAKAHELTLDAARLPLHYRYITVTLPLHYLREVSSPASAMARQSRSICSGPSPCSRLLSSRDAPKGLRLGGTCIAERAPSSAPPSASLTADAADLPKLESCCCTSAAEGKEEEEEPTVAEEVVRERFA